MGRWCESFIVSASTLVETGEGPGNRPLFYLYRGYEHNGIEADIFWEHLLDICCFVSDIFYLQYLHYSFFERLGFVILYWSAIAAHVTKIDTLPGNATAAAVILQFSHSLKNQNRITHTPDAHFGRAKFPENLGKLRWRLASTRRTARWL